MIKSIKLRLTLFYITVSFITVSIFATVLAIVFTQNIRHKYTREVDIELYREYEDIEEQLLEYESSSWSGLINSAISNYKNNTFYIQIVKYSKKTGWVTDTISRSQTIISNTDVPNALYLTVSQYDTILKTGLALSTVKGQFPHHVRVFSAPFKELRQSYYILQVGRDLADMQAQMSKTRINIAIAMLGFFAILVIIMFIFVKRLFGSVRTIINNVNKITESDLAVRLDSYESDDEIGELITTFNALLDRLEESFIRIKHFSSDISHELKTPLTIIRGEIDTILKKERTAEEYRSKLISIQEEENRLASTIENLLVLSRIDSKDPHIMKKMSVDIVMLEAFEEKLKAAGRKGISLNMLEFDETYINGVPGLIKSAILNLIDNALKYSQSNTSVTFSLVHNNGYAELSIQDEGAGIPEHLIEYLCTRHYRAHQDGHVEGYGLGLAIVKKITELHNGKIQIISQVNQGSVFKLIFPLASN